MARPSRWPKWSIRVIKAAVTIGLIAWLVKSGFLDRATLQQLTQSAAIVPVTAALLFFLLSQAIAGVRLLVLLRAIDHELSLSNALALTFVGAFFNLTLPGSVGGDVVKGYYLYQGESSDRGRTSGIVLADRLIGLAAMLIVGGVASAYLAMGHTMQGPIRHFLLAAATLAVVAVASFPLVLILGSSSRAYGRMKKFFAGILGDGARYNLARALGALTRRPGLLSAAMLMSLAIQTLSLLGVYSLMWVSGAPGSPLSLIAVSSLVMIAGLLPVTPGNIGWTEFVAAYGWSAAGSSVGAQVFIWWRLVSIAGSLPGAVIYQLGPSAKVAADREGLEASQDAKAV